MDSTQRNLIIDDRDDDFDATFRALPKGKNLRNPRHCCQDGKQALDYLFRRGPYQKPGVAVRPGTILLDLNLPGIDGRSVLAEIKGTNELKSIPVIVMANSDDQRDIKDCCDRGANTNILTPLNGSSFFNAMPRVKEYWSEIAILPKA